MKETKIAPSVLSADFSKMGEEVKSLEACGADLVHCDVMDGVFVNNITFGIKMVEDLRKCTALPLRLSSDDRAPGKICRAVRKKRARTSSRCITRPAERL